MPDGEGTDPKSVAYLRFPLHTMVFEGTGELRFLVAPPKVATMGQNVPHPQPAGVTVAHRTPVDDDWRAPVPVTFGTEMSIPVAPRETDMPHSRSSLWAFRLVSDRNEYGTLNVTVTIVRGADVEKWPGHPDLYAERDERVVFDGTGRTEGRSTLDEYLYGPDQKWVHPDFLIAGNTGKIDVYVNITKIEKGVYSEPNAFYLEYHNATGLDTDTSALYIRTVEDPAGRDMVDPFYHFTITTHPEGMDSPYFTKSRWGFRLGATTKTTLPSGGTTQVSYDNYAVEFTMKIIARKYVPPERPEA